MAMLHRRLNLHPRFERLLLATALAGAATWAPLELAHLAGRHWTPALIATVGIPLTLTLGFRFARPDQAPAGLLALLAVAGSLPALLWFPRYPAFAILAGGAVLGLGLPSTGRWLPRINAALALGVATFAGVYVAAAVGSTRLVALVPPLLAYALMGALFGFIAGFGHLATHARWERDHVELLFRARRKHGIVPPLAVQALHLYRRIRETLPRGTHAGPWHDTRRTVSRLVLQVLGLATQSQDMGEHIALSDVDELTRRRQAMRDAAAGAQDAEAQRHYADTAAVLGQRLERLRQFGQRRERVEALCHHCLSVLENLRLALAQAQLTGQSAGVDEVTTALHRLNALQSELDCTAEALRELEPDVATGRPPPAGPVAPEPAT